jgi:hypothetical protein
MKMSNIPTLLRYDIADAGGLRRLAKVRSVAMNRWTIGPVNLAGSSAGYGVSRLAAA